MKLLSRAGSFAVSTAAGLGRPGQLGSGRERPEPPGLGVPGGLRSVLQLNPAGRGGGRPAAWGRRALGAGPVLGVEETNAREPQGGRGLRASEGHGDRAGGVGPGQAAAGPGAASAQAARGASVSRGGGLRVARDGGVSSGPRGVVTGPGVGSCGCRSAPRAPGVSAVGASPVKQLSLGARRPCAAAAERWWSGASGTLREAQRGSMCPGAARWLAAFGGKPASSAAVSRGRVGRVERGGGPAAADAQPQTPGAPHLLEGVGRPGNGVLRGLMLK